MAIPRNVSASAPRRFAGRFLGCKAGGLVPVYTCADSNRSWTHGTEEVRGYDASVGVVAVPSKLVKHVFSVGLNIPIAVRLVTDAKVGYRI